MPTYLTASLVALSLTATIGVHGADWYAHNGRIINATTKVGVSGAIATAASSNRRITSEDDCPKYDGFIDDAVSNPDGTFTLRIPTGNTSYIVTYCHPAYEAYTPPANDNLDGAPVKPQPIRLWPYVGTPQGMYAALTYLEEDTKAAIVSLTASPAAFAATAKSLPPAEQALIKQWVSIPETTEVPSPAAVAEATAVLQDATASLQTTLTYFAEADPVAFRTQVTRRNNLSEYARKRAITPREPFNEPQPPAAQEPPPSTPGSGRCVNATLAQATTIGVALRERHQPRAAIGSCFQPYFATDALTRAPVHVQEHFLFEYLQTSSAAAKGGARDRYYDEAARVAKFYVTWYPSWEQRLPLERRRISTVVAHLGNIYAELQHWPTLIDEYTAIARAHPTFLRDERALLNWYKALRSTHGARERSLAAVRDKIGSDQRHYEDWCVFFQTAIALENQRRYSLRVRDAMAFAREVLKPMRCRTPLRENSNSAVQ